MVICHGRALCLNGDRAWENIRNAAYQYSIEPVDITVHGITPITPIKQDIFIAHS